jgi:aromatic ring hydroxylase
VRRNPLAADANNISKVSHVREKLSLYAGASELAYAAASLRPSTAKDVERHLLPNEIYANVGRRMTGEMIYHEYNILTRWRAAYR